MKRILNLILIFTLLSAGVAVPALAAGPGPDSPSGPNSIFAPFLFRPAFYDLTGQVLNKSGTPVAGVSILTETGQQVTTNASGQYKLSVKAGRHSLTASKSGLVFAPAEKELNVTSALSGQNFQALTPNADLFGGNGTFELGTQTYWTLSAPMAGNNELNASFATDRAHTGSYSAFTGLGAAATNQLGHSYVKSPVVTISANGATLSVWVYRTTTVPRTKSVQGVLDTASADGDQSYIDIVNPTTGASLRTLMAERVADTGWVNLRYTIAEAGLLGAQVQFVFGTYNDGAGGMTAMYVDDAVLENGYVNPTSVDLLSGNGDFETNSASYWTRSTTVSGSSIAAVFNTTDFYHGAQSAQMGVGLSDPLASGVSYFLSPLIGIPWDTRTLQVVFYYKMISGLPTNAPQRPNANTAKVIVESATGGQSVSADLPSVTTWTRYAYNVPLNTAGFYPGNQIRLRFQTSNDGTAAFALLVDYAFLNYSTSLFNGCTNLISNGGFEMSPTPNQWFPNQPAAQFPYPASIVTENPHSGSRSAHLGPYWEGQNYGYLYDSQVRIKVSLPATATYAYIDLWWYPINTGLSYPQDLLDKAPKPGTLVKDSPFAAELADKSKDALRVNAPSDDEDTQYLTAWDESMTHELATFIYHRKDSRTWDEHWFDVVNGYDHWGNRVDLRGKTFWLVAGVGNDGWNGISELYVDDVALYACPSGVTAPPEPPWNWPYQWWPQPVGQCYEGLGNNSFEYDSDWWVPLTAYTADYSNAVARTGQWSMRAGITNPAANRYAYSDFFQDTIIPWDATSATLTYWMYPIGGGWWPWLSNELSTLTGGPTRPDDPLYNVQYLLAMDEWGNQLGTLDWELSNTQGWVQRTYNLLPYRGYNLRLQWGAYNSGWGPVTAQYVDDVNLNICR